MFGFIPNLHITLLGDEIRAGTYVPYGKQLVRQLLLNDRYSNKRSISPADGVLVEAWVSGEHRWIRITVIGCKAIFMDSGVVDLHNIGWANPELTGMDGTLHYSTAIKSYVAQNQLLGKIKPPSISCSPSIELRSTPAFAAELTETGARDPNSESLLAVKKAIVGRVPASIFTGKLRLYFQAHYGKKLADWKFQINSANQPPSLDLSMRTSSGDDVIFQFHSAHTGIVTDRLKRHWLVQFGIKGAYASADKVHLFLMRAPACVEQLRAKLLPSSTLSDADKERVETYLLSQSYPDWDFCIPLACSIPANWNLGYGWHFNWDGNRADIVSIGTTYLGGVAYKHTSTHYRITIERNASYVDDPTNTELQNEARRWKATLETIETQDWKNSKWGQVIASPDWESGALAVFGQMWGDRYGTAAPIYCFYTRNDLKVVRFTHTGGTAGWDYMMSSSPAYFHGNYSYGSGQSTIFACSGTTIGFEGAQAEWRARAASPISTSFSVEGASVSSSEDGYSFKKVNISGKSLTGNNAWYSWTYAPVGMNVSSGVQTVTSSSQYGCPLTFSDIPTVHAAPGDFRASFSVELAYNATFTEATHVEASNKLVVIPFGDAEAAYIWGNKTHLDTGLTNTTSYLDNANTNHIRLVQCLQGGEWTAEVNAYTNFPGSGVTPYSNSSSSILGSYLVSNAGVMSDVPMAVKADFFAGEPNTLVSEQFWTTTSAGTDASIKGSGVPLTDGYNSNLYGTFIGWA